MSNERKLKNTIKKEANIMLKKAKSHLVFCMEEYASGGYPDKDTLKGLELYGKDLSHIIYAHTLIMNEQYEKAWNVFYRLDTEPRELFSDELIGSLLFLIEYKKNFKYKS